MFGEEGSDVLAGGPGSDRLDGGPGDDTFRTRDGVRDVIEGRAGVDVAQADRVDYAFDVERGNLRYHRHPSPPTKAEIVAVTEAAVKASAAKLVRLEVVMPRVSYSLTVRVADPAAYLKHRANTLVDVMNEVTIRPPPPFADVYFTVEDGSGHDVFAYSETTSGGRTAITWKIEPRYVDCARGIDLDI